MSRGAPKGPGEGRRSSKGPSEPPRPDERESPDVVEDAGRAVDAAAPELDEAEAEVEALGVEQEAEAPPSPVRALARPELAIASRDALQAYMREVARHPLLTREEEHDLAVRLRESGDVDAAYRLVTANLRLVVKIAHEYHRASVSLLDLIQEGNVGLMHAVRKFDPYRGVKLSSYAAWWIRAYILRFVMDNFRMVKIGTTQAQRKLFFNLRKEQDRMAALGFEPTAPLLAERLHVSEREVVEMDQRLSQDESSLDVPVVEGSRTSRADRIPGTSIPADERLADYEIQTILRQKLAEFGRRLEGRELTIFEKRLTAEEPMTLQEIGDQFGLTRERARQIEAGLVRRLKAWLQREVPDFKDLEIGPRRP